MMDIDQEVMIGAQLDPMDADGWPIFSKDMGSGRHGDHDESIMAKAMQDAARPSIARAGDQRAALQLRQAGVDITKNKQAALETMRQAKKEEAARNTQALQADSSTPPPNRRSSATTSSRAQRQARPRTRARTRVRARRARSRSQRSCTNKDAMSQV